MLPKSGDGHSAGRAPSQGNRNIPDGGRGAGPVLRCTPNGAVCREVSVRGFSSKYTRVSDRPGASDPGPCTQPRPHTLGPFLWPRTRPLQPRGQRWGRAASFSTEA